MRDIVGKFKRAIRKPPKVLVARLVAELRAETEVFAVPLKRKLPLSKILSRTGCASIEELWTSLGAIPYFTNTQSVDLKEYNRYFPGDSDRIIMLAKKAIDHKVNLLGTGEIYLGDPIAWNVDFKVGKSWQNQFYRRIDYLNVREPSDVKIPWEISRLQWAIPLGQAYLLTGEEHYALKIREIITSWCRANPYGGSINWTCTMEVALRIFSLTWFFHVFKASDAWSDSEFRILFLKTLYLHCEFTELHIERNNINGNHFTADAAAMVVAGIFWGVKSSNWIANRWLNNGWQDLLTEIEIQVSEDGCDYEASVAYHRLVAELFLFAAIYRKKNDFSLSEVYSQRLAAMGEFTRAYMPSNGLAPLLGDADDARVLPFGGQNLGDHRYLPDLICQELFGDSEFKVQNCTENFWINRQYSSDADNYSILSSKSFPKGGYYIIRDQDSHIFIDCAPVGLADTGGHGHNDALSFEAVLRGKKIFSDSGAFVYTASYQERNLFRSTAYHNIPKLNDLEINRFVRDDYLWNFHNDARPRCLDWQVSSSSALFIGEHYGYAQPHGLISRRMIEFDFQREIFLLVDYFTNIGQDFEQKSSAIEITYQLILDPEVKVTMVSNNCCNLQVSNQLFAVKWCPQDQLRFNVEPARISPSYGLVQSSTKLVWRAAMHKQELSKMKFLIMVLSNLDLEVNFDEYSAAALLRLSKALNRN